SLASLVAASSSDSAHAGKTHRRACLSIWRTCFVHSSAYGLKNVAQTSPPNAQREKQTTCTTSAPKQTTVSNSRSHCGTVTHTTYTTYTTLLAYWRGGALQHGFNTATPPEERGRKVWQVAV